MSRWWQASDAQLAKNAERRHERQIRLDESTARRAGVRAFIDQADAKRADAKAERVMTFALSQSLLVCTQCQTAGHVQSTLVKRRNLFLRKIRFRVMHCGLCGMSWTVI